jgi:uncharacterized protein YeaO (DUF488 family)
MVRQLQPTSTDRCFCPNALPRILTDLVSTGKVMLLFGAHDTGRNNAVALADYLAAH